MADQSDRILELLAAELRAARKLTGATQREWETLTGIAQARISRAEQAKAVLSRPQTVRWLNIAEVSKETRERVLALTEAAHNQTRSWDGLLENQQLQTHAQRRDESARLVRNCQLAVVPGLLQTAAYARLVLAETSPPGADLAAQLAGRMARQEVLYQEGRRFEFLIAESVLLWSPGPGVMAAQLDRLVSLSTLTSVELAILPARRTGNLAWHSFIYRGPRDPEADPYVTLELPSAQHHIRDPEEVAGYGNQFERLWAAAVTGEAAVELIRSASRE